MATLPDEHDDITALDDARAELERAYIQQAKLAAENLIRSKRLAAMESALAEARECLSYPNLTVSTMVRLRISKAVSAIDALKPLRED